MRRPVIRKPFNLPPYAVAICCAAGLGAAVFTAQPVLAKQLNDWRLLPRPERLTELYFTDHDRLPAAATAGTIQRLSFTVHNLEGRATAYHYQLVVTSADSHSRRQVGGGTLVVGAGQSLVANDTLMLPWLDRRMAIMVELDYQESGPSGRASTSQTQSIDYWVEVTHPRAGG
ncbi:MAG TPA: hypothetical protein VLI05_01510 [Candidatus Saccharimonadia bacterium]|nr:hypothetical protein [Candidatus Saccharimonadia bacterium]